MYQKVKLRSLKKILPRSIAALVLAVILLAASGFGVFTLLSKPQALASVPEAELEGAYVSFDLSQVIASFASEGSHREFYILKLDENKFMSLTASEKYFEKLALAASQSEDYYMNNSGILNKLGTCSGKVTALDEELYAYFTDWVDEVGVLITDESKSVQECCLQLTVELGAVNGRSNTLIWVLSGIALALILYAAAEIVMVLTGVYSRKLKDVVGEDNMDEVDEEFDTAPVFGHIRVGRTYTWYWKGASPRAVATKDIIWAFNQLDSHLMGKYPHILTVYLTDRSCLELGTHTPEERAEIAGVIAGYGNPFVYGYSQDRAHMFAHNFARFKTLAAKAAGERAAQ